MTGPRVIDMPPKEKQSSPTAPDGLTESLLERWEQFWAQPEAGRLTALDRLAVVRLFTYMGEWESICPVPGRPLHQGMAWAEVFKLEAAIGRLEARISRAMQAT